LVVSSTSQSRLRIANAAVGDLLLLEHL
jgi:hypothetical protein